MVNELKGKKLIVIADNAHKGAFNALFLGSKANLDYICDVSHSPEAPLNPKNVKEYLQKNSEKYDGAIICNCCDDSLEILTNKEIFPGRVIFFDYSGSPPSQEGIDLYFSSGICMLHKSEVLPDIKRILV